MTFFVNFGLLKPDLVIRVLIITYDPRPAGVEALGKTSLPSEHVRKQFDRDFN